VCLRGQATYLLTAGAIDQCMNARLYHVAQHSASQRRAMPCHDTLTARPRQTTRLNVSHHHHQNQHKRTLFDRKVSSLPDCRRMVTRRGFTSAVYRCAKVVSQSLLSSFPQSSPMMHAGEISILKLRCCSQGTSSLNHSLCRMPASLSRLSRAHQRISPAQHSQETLGSMV
jgi:hypothetical protein